MNIQDIRNLINFHYWGRNRILDAVDLITPEQFTKDVGGSFGSVRNTLVHTLSAECVWLARWRSDTPPGWLVADTFATNAAVRIAWIDHERKLRAFFETMDEQGIQRVLPYKTLDGQDAASPLWQMLQHVVNHATYHRGQVTTLLRQLGAAPPLSTDLIRFYRENP
jgi:uncharacterized damage-inducible protein DinB